MKIAGQHGFSKNPKEVWKSLQDPAILAATLPGVRRLEVVGPDRYSISAQIGVGSIKGLFDGTFSVEDKKDYESCVLKGSARGPSGTAEIEAAVQLSEADAGGTALDYDATAMVTGPIAGVGQRMISAASKRMAAQFFDAVDAYDEARAPAQQAARPAGEARTGQVFERPQPPTSDTATFVRGVAVGFLLAVAGVAVGRWSARR
jgi:carbon monoxide dehydrogenase subunit G